MQRKQLINSNSIMNIVTKLVTPSQSNHTAKQHDISQDKEMIQSLQQEIQCLKREKLFLLQKLQSTVPDQNNLELERKRADLAEKLLS